MTTRQRQGFMSEMEGLIVNITEPEDLRTMCKTTEITKENVHLYYDNYNKWMMVNNKNLNSIYVPEGIRELYCQKNHLTELKLPKGITHVYCSGNKLTEVDIPDSVEIFFGIENPWDADFVKWFKMKNPDVKAEFYADGCAFVDDIDYALSTKRASAILQWNSGPLLQQFDHSSWK